MPSHAPTLCTMHIIVELICSHHCVTCVIAVIITRVLTLLAPGMPPVQAQARQLAGVGELRAVRAAGGAVHRGRARAEAGDGPHVRQPHAH